MNNGCKSDFLIFKNNPKLVYLDSAASAQKPQVVLDAMNDFYTKSYANIHRGIYRLSEQATTMFEGARETVANFLNAHSGDQIVFTKNATESINLVANSFGADLPDGSTIVITEMEHHANFVPWVELAKRRNLNLVVVPLNSDGIVTADEIMEFITDEVFMVAVTQLSNVMGARIDVKRVITKAKAHGARVLVDGSQSVVHMPIDLAEMDPDFFVFSSHKLYGPTGVGVLYIKEELMDGMRPFLVGGDMVLKVSANEILYQKSPHRFEAGTPDIAGVIGLAEAIRYVQKIGMDNIEQEDIAKCSYAYDKLIELDFVEIYGPHVPAARVSAIIFNVKNVHSHDTAQILADLNICVRAGNHCAQPLHKALGIDATVRASFGIYNDYEDIDKLVDGLKKVSHKFA